jgi:hypothetical protein
LSEPLTVTLSKSSPPAATLIPLHAWHSYKAFLEAADIRESRVDRYMGHANH